MSREVSNWLVSGLQLIYKWVITRLLPMSKFLGHPSTNQSIFKGRKSTHLDPSRSLLVSLPRIVSWRLVDDPMLRLKATQLESVEPGCCGLYDSYPKGSMHGILPTFTINLRQNVAKYSEFHTYYMVFFLIV